MKKIFISHATKDKEIVEELIDLLETIGISSTQIFCSSFEGYGIPLGGNFLDTIKEELSAEVLVLFVITNNFYDSKVCLCEMGAAWALSKEHIPIVVPPLSYSDIQAVIPLTQGLLINNAPKLNEKKDIPLQGNTPTKKVVCNCKTHVKAKNFKELVSLLLSPQFAFLIETGCKGKGFFQISKAANHFFSNML